jgi:Putative bacterial sensory transduction regulator
MTRPRSERPGEAERSIQHTTPLTTQRVSARLLALGYQVIRDDDDDLVGVWGEDRVWFLHMGQDEEIFQVRGRWHHTLPPEQRAALLLSTNDWNRTRILPKAYVRTEAGRLAVYAEVSVDFGEGVTDDQLDSMIRRGLATSGALFTALDQQMLDDTSGSA